MDVLGDRPDLVLGEPVERLAHELELVGEVRGPGAARGRCPRSTRGTRVRGAPPRSRSAGARSAGLDAPRRLACRRRAPRGPQIASAMNARASRDSYSPCSRVLEHHPAARDRARRVGEVVRQRPGARRAGRPRCGPSSLRAARGVGTPLVDDASPAWSTAAARGRRVASGMRSSLHGARVARRAAVLGTSAGRPVVGSVRDGRARHREWSSAGRGVSAARSAAGGGGRSPAWCRRRTACRRTAVEPLRLDARLRVRRARPAP